LDVYRQINENAVNTASELANKYAKEVVWQVLGHTSELHNLPGGYIPDEVVSCFPVRD
jgi:hypothetical protein